ncbi:XdhC family protein [Bacillus sp. NSP9.1]|uniref:XdhC family protein n=1 Tax=Bacillus sp. NSP9.1 TaxID=1071078 RepID=UPI0004230CBD|nr:XdhC family protein [Bacillus sp. NSP9.1]QHZ45696.1 XdhC family protein [Bacillus sp. NSP9.1]
MKAIAGILKTIQRLPQQCVLTTIHVEDSAMLLQEEGTRTGMLSAGCIEDDPAVRDMAGQHSGETRTFTYHLKAGNDLAWEDGAGCHDVSLSIAAAIPLNQLSLICELARRVKEGRHDLH